MRFFNTVAAVVLGLAAVANGHMEMSYPPPFRSKFNANYPDHFSDEASNMKSPLDSQGANYPCKGYHTDLGTPAGKSVVIWAPGGAYNFTITGQTYHDGGSCQASLSYDKGQTFKVIHSYIGGCPPPGDSSWDFTVPADAPAGEALFAWTWFNNLGNREMYMNCAAVTIGAGKKRAASVPFASRPDIFLANIGPKGNGAITPDSKDVDFPQPGNEVDRRPSLNAAAPPAGGSSGSPSSACRNVGSGSGSGSNFCFSGPEWCFRHRAHGRANSSRRWHRFQQAFGCNFGGSLFNGRCASASAYRWQRQFQPFQLFQRDSPCELFDNCRIKVLYRGSVELPVWRKVIPAVRCRTVVHLYACGRGNFM
ncbi:hypothetical protein TASIC1_0010010500 [Trichoderma asperellum]|uniref:Extracellular protein n=1 Tax=Trichoderma asperellum TaxID=101201 RepID=A0A6V8QZS2_TRIAP|nr:hypothetical protein TASIC1_0010010500 [Trichoderma asperellum]